MILTDADKRELLDVARRAVVAQVTGLPPLHVDQLHLPTASGVFVTIKRGSELRGCLGTLQHRRGLAEEVARCAADAATYDPRFAPVAIEELAELSLDISVLGPLELIDPCDPGAIVIGRHGLAVEKGRHHGLLLPQVATELEWTREQFLRHTCMKAGLHPDAWRQGAAVYRFDAEVFGD